MSRIRVECRHRYADGFDLHAAFESGDGVTALFGPSGSGKTTTLHILAGLLRPTAGRVLLGERVLLDTAAGLFVPPERRRIGLVFQDHLLFPHLSVRANLRYGLVRRPGRRIDLERAVEILELRQVLDRHPHTLSGGERQRAALGRAILRGPELLLLDEPLTALDEPLKERILSYLERVLAEWRIPTLFVSHDQADVRRLAEHVVVLEAGRVVDAGPTAATLDRAVILEMKSPPGPVNLLRVDGVQQVEGHWEGRVRGQRIQLPALAGAPDSAVFVQFLPSDVTLTCDTVAGLSVRNQLTGCVRDVILLPGRAFVAVDVGQLLWAEVTPEALRELGLRVDSLVTCLVKTSAMRILR